MNAQGSADHTDHSPQHLLQCRLYLLESGLLELQKKQATKLFLCGVPSLVWGVFGEQGDSNPGLVAPVRDQPAAKVLYASL